MDVMNQFQVEQVLNALRGIKPLLFQYQELSAGIMFNYFQELTKAGFADDQALYIVAEHGLMPPVEPSKEGE